MSEVLVNLRDVRVLLFWKSGGGESLHQGDHVRVIGGRYEGDTGLIVRVEDNLIVLFSDLTMHELKTMPKDLQLCTDMATGVDSLGQYQFGDLVQIDPQTVGVIVQIQKESFQVGGVAWCAATGAEEQPSRPPPGAGAGSLARLA